MRKLILALGVALVASVVPAQAHGDEPEAEYECLGRAGHQADDSGGYDAWHFDSGNWTPIGWSPRSLCNNVSPSDPSSTTPSGAWIDLESTSGTLTCGTGELSGTGRAWFTDHRFWTWDGTFVDGVGTITGEVVDGGVTWALSGTVILPAASAPACQDAQPEWPTHNAVATFVIE